MSSSRLQVMRPEDVYTTYSRLLEMVPSKRLHNAFKWLKWKCFMDIQKMSSKWQLQVIRFEVVYNVSSRSFNGKAPKRLYVAFKLFNVLKTSSTGL